MQWENKINAKLVISVTSEGDLSGKQLQNIEKNKIINECNVASALQLRSK